MPKQWKYYQKSPKLFLSARILTPLHEINDVKNDLVKDMDHNNNTAICNSN